MDVRLSNEQKALRDSAVQMLAQLGPKSVGDLDDATRAARLDSAIADAGWRELRTAREDGAPWASAVEVAIIAEELGRALGDAAFVGPTLAADLRRRAGASEAVGPETVALRADLATLARDGAPAVAVDADRATTALIGLDVDGGTALATTATAPAHTRTDLTRPMADTSKTEPVAVDEGRPLDGADLDAWSALGLALTCADLVGTMRGAITLATDYATDRHQYGRPVGSFQAVQHMLADALVAMEGARSTTLHAAWAVDELAPADALVAAAMAKAWCARAARSVCETSIQVHGGIGNTWECLAHVHLRRALLSIDLLGGTGPNLDRVLAHHGIGADDGLR